MPAVETLLSRALNAKRESKFIEFKESFDVSAPQDWCELIKDIVSLANTGGGIILIGVDNRGAPTRSNVEPVLKLDPADISNKVHKYTDWHFSEFEITEQTKKRAKIAAIQIAGVPIPVVFTKPGTYDIGGGKQKNAFSVGTVYFRHGAKSEPGSTEDIRKAIDRQLSSIRKDWIRGVRKVVAAPRNSQLVVVPPQSAVELQGGGRIKVVNDPQAPAVRLTREEVPGATTFVHEEISDGLFDEINNVLDANKLLAKGSGKFVLGHPVYYRIYAERYHVKVDTAQLQLLAKTGLSDIYGPVLYWLNRLSVTETAHMVRDMCHNPRIPFVYTAIRIVVLLGSDATTWLHDLWEQRWHNFGQKPEYCWRIKAIMAAEPRTNRRLLALRTLSGVGQQVNDGEHTYTVEELLSDQKLAAACLSNACLKVFEGDKEFRSLCRQLDLITYASEIESRAAEIASLLVPAMSASQHA